MKRALIVGILIVFGLVGCSNSNNPTTIPSTIRSQVQQTAGQAVCDLQTQLLSVLTQVQATTLDSVSSVTSKLQDVQTKLQDQADSLAAQGATPLADQVRNAANAVGQLASAVTSGDTSAIVSAGAKVAGVISQIPGCPSASPSA
jgi:hypothetical protein